MLTNEQVEKVAKLGRLELRADEIEKFSAQLGAVIDYMKVLNSVDTTDVEPLIYAVPVHNVFRKDQMRASLQHDAALQNAPESDGEYFVAPTVVGS